MRRPQPAHDAVRGARSGRARHQWLHPAGVFALLAVVFGASAPVTVGLEDDGFFCITSAAAGVSHPPGYPLHALLGWLTVRLVPGHPILAAHLFSALCGAATCAVFHSLLHRLLGVRWLAWCGALAYGLSPTFWSQAIVAEVYTLNALLCWGLCALALEVRALRGQQVDLRALALVLGLGLANHWPLVVLCLPALLVWMAPARRGLARAAWRALPWLAVGLLPYVWMVWRSWDPSVPSFYGSIESWQEFWFFVSRQGYQGIEQSALSGWGDKLGLSGFLGWELATQFTLAGLGLVLWGAVAQRRRLGTGTSVALVALFLLHSVVLVLLLGFEDSSLYRSALRVYPLVAYGTAAIWLTVGLERLTDVMRGSRARAAALGPACGALLCAVLAVGGWQAARHEDRSWGHDYARAVLESLSPDAVLFVSGDVAAGTIGALHQVEGMRPDVRLLSPQGLLFPDRLFHPLRTPLAEARALLEEVVADPARPVFVIGPLEHVHGRVFGGLWTRIQREHHGTRSELSPRALAYLESIIHRQPRDAWVRRHRLQLMGSFGGVLAEICLDPARQEEAARLAGLAAAVRGSIPGQLAYVRAVLKAGRTEPLDELWRWSEEVAPDLDLDLSRVQRADFFHARGHLAARRGEPARAVEAWRTSLAIHPVAANPALRNLLEHHAQHRERAAYFALRERYFSQGPFPAYLPALEARLRD